RNSTASHSEVDKPKPTTVRPQQMTATAMTAPERDMRENQPENSPKMAEPSGIAANSHPSAGPPPGGSPNVVSAISGNSARGMPATIAMMSTRNDTISSLRAAR